MVPAVAQRWLDHHREHARTDLRHAAAAPGRRLPARRRGRPPGRPDARLHAAAGVRHGRGAAELHPPGRPRDVICTPRAARCATDDEILVVDELGATRAGRRPRASLLTRGPYTPRGYYRAAEQNARAFTADGWYRTGDIVRLPPDGNLVVEGRDKDMINRGGEKISAEEVENFAYQLPGVAMRRRRGDARPRAR